MFHRWKRAPRALPEAAGDEIECIYGDQRSYSGRRMTNNEGSYHMATIRRRCA
jgi:hypothetical protein